MYWTIRRKADKAFFPIVAGSRANSWIEFPDLGDPAVLPARLFKTAGAAKGTLTNWLKGPLYKVHKSRPGTTWGLDDFGAEEVSCFEHVHDPKRGTKADYEVIAVTIVPVQEQLL